MNGIEKIIDRISGDVQTEIDGILAKAKAEAAEVTAGYEAKAKAEADEILSRGRRAADEREERLTSVAQLECRKAELAAKQEVIEEAFDLALSKLRALPEAEYVELLARLAVQASATGKEELIFSPEDREKVGGAVVSAANGQLGNGALTVSEQTRPINGGFILSDGAVEVNCSFETLVRLQKAEITGEVTGLLFG